MIEQSLIPYVSAALASSVGNRLYPQKAPDNLSTKPYCVYSLVSAVTEHCQDEAAFRSWRFQFSIFSTSYTEAITLRDVLLTNLDGYRGNLNTYPSEVVAFMDLCATFYEADTQLHHVAVDFTITESL